MASLREALGAALDGDSSTTEEVAAPVETTAAAAPAEADITPAEPAETQESAPGERIRDGLGRFVPKDASAAAAPRRAEFGLIEIDTHSEGRRSSRARGGPAARRS